MTDLDLAAIRARHVAFEDAWDHEYMGPTGPKCAARSAEDVPALLAEVERLRSALAEIADYAVERQHAVAAGQGLAQAALAAIAVTARRAVGAAEVAL